MSSKSNYSEKEWELIATIPQLTGLLMSTAAYSGIEGTKDELEASVKSIAEGKFKYPENDLILSIIPTGDTLEDIMNKIEQQQKKIMSEIYIEDEKSLKRFHKNTLASYKSVIHYISKHETGLVADEFRNWLLTIAEDVAVAAIEGTVFGQEKDPFSEEEREIFARIERSLSENSSK